MLYLIKNCITLLFFFKFWHLYVFIIVMYVVKECTVDSHTDSHH